MAAAAPPPPVPLVDQAAAATAIKNGFVGWHYESSDAFNSKTVAAFACNELKAKVLLAYAGKEYDATKDGDYLNPFLPVVNPAVAIPVPSNALVNDKPRHFANALMLRPDGQMVLDEFHKKFQLLQPATCYVTGPSEGAVSTLCRVSDLYVQTAFYTIIASKTAAHVQKVWLAWKESSDNGYNEDFQLQPNCVALRLKGNPNTQDDFWRQPQYLLDTKFTNLLFDEITPIVEVLAVKKQYAASVANVYLAMRVQHICDIDSGNVFRDRHGRAAASLELQTATETLLYNTYV